ncbi:MAG TPA: ACP S-malonyltransferase [Clostridiaceae bacterium]|nr:ACP S-malonyltransferase [Clostridiaceae bacterium]
MGKIAFIFPGQGAQYIGMGQQISSQYPSAKKVYKEASEALGFDLEKMVFEGDEETLKITENTQPAILTTSIACLQPFLEKGIQPDVTAGLSLGEYTAHVLSGTMEFKDAVALVRKRGKYMQEAVPVGVGGMAAIIGLSDEDTIACCNEASDCGIVEPVNFNCPGQLVIAGEKEAVEKAVAIAGSKGAKRAVMLPVSAPFHSSLLKPAGEMLKKELDKVNLNEMKIPVVSNVTADYVRDTSLVKNLLVKQVSSPVKWEASMRKMIQDGVDTFVEIGPGKALTGFMKRISKDVNCLNVEDIDTLYKAFEFLGA